MIRRVIKRIRRRTIKGNFSIIYSPCGYRITGGNREPVVKSRDRFYDLDPVAFREVPDELTYKDIGESWE